METQKVILPFFYALFLPEFPQETSQIPVRRKTMKNHTPNPSLKSRWKKNKITPNNFLFIQSHKKNPRIRQKYHFHLIPGFLLLLLLLI